MRKGSKGKKEKRGRGGKLILRLRRESGGRWEGMGEVVWKMGKEGE